MLAGVNEVDGFGRLEHESPLGRSVAQGMTGGQIADALVARFPSRRHECRPLAVALLAKPSPLFSSSYFIVIGRNSREDQNDRYRL